MTARLTASVLVGALIRKAQGEGGFAAVLATGDPLAGAVIVVLAERGVKSLVLERILLPSGGYAWQETGNREEDGADLVARRRRFDPDLWVVELDVSSTRLFAQEMNEVG